MTAPYDRVYTEDAVGQNRDRVKKLENAAGPSGGIDFNKDNSTDSAGNPADYLLINVVGTDASAGIQINNDSNTGGIGFNLVNNNDDLFKILQTGDGGMTIENAGSGTQLIKNDGGETHIDNFADLVRMGTSGSNKDLITYVKDGNIYWYQGGSGGSPIAALIFNGVSLVYDLHLQVGAVVINDL